MTVRRIRPATTGRAAPVAWRVGLPLASGDCAASRIQGRKSTSADECIRAAVVKTAGWSPQGIALLVAQVCRLFKKSAGQGFESRDGSVVEDLTGLLFRRYQVLSRVNLRGVFPWCGWGFIGFFGCFGSLDGTG